MRILLTLFLSLGLLFLAGPLGAQMVEDAELPEAPEAGEVRVTATTLSEAIPEIRQQLAAGVREVNVRNLGPNELGAFLSTGGTNPLVQIAGDLGPGQRVDFRLAGARFRVQNKEGQLRVRIRDVVVQDREALARAFAGFDRIEIRGVDGMGNRVRFEIRDGNFDNPKKDEVKADRRGRGREGTSASINNDEHARDRGKDLDHGIRGRDRAEMERERHADRPDRDGRDRSGRERSGRSGRN